MSNFATEGRTPAQWAAELGTRGIKTSGRVIREKARRLGAFGKIGREMVLSPDDIDAFFRKQNVLQPLPTGSQFWFYDLTVDGVRERKSTKTAQKSSPSRKPAPAKPSSSVLPFTGRIRRNLQPRGRPLSGCGQVRSLPGAAARPLEGHASEGHHARRYQAGGAGHPSGKKPGTWNRLVITPAKAVINHAAEFGHCGHIRVKKYPVAKTLKRAVDRAYIDAFREHAPPKLGALMLFLNQSACRISAALALDWDRDVDLSRREIVIERDKNGDPHIVYLSVEMRAVLANLPKDTKTVFGYRTRHDVYYPIKAACKRAGIPFLATHQPGRHSFATEMIVRKRVDIKTTAKLGNWKSERILIENYAHADENGHAVIDEVFGTTTAQRRHK